MSDKRYQKFISIITEQVQAAYFISILDKARELIKTNSPGSNVIRYLLYGLNNRIIKLQFNDESCEKLSGLNLGWGCIPFDKMPFATSLIGHNPKIYDLLEYIDSENREHELLARLIINNTEKKGILYTRIEDLSAFENIGYLMQAYNEKLYRKHKPSREIKEYKKHIYIHGYEQDTLHIINKLKNLSESGIQNYSGSIDSWLNSTSDHVDREDKKQILQKMFKHSRVALIYGAAGTGKTRLIEHISSFLHDRNKMYLANTNPAVTNLKNRIHTRNADFNTIYSYLKENNDDTVFDLLVIDECSTVSNSDMLKVLEKASFRLLVLVGDVFQIESILFGNWFGIAKSIIYDTSIFELTHPLRTTNNELLNLWEKVRNIKDDIKVHIVENKYSSKLDESIFEYSEEDEIILCLNYDGLYGINNINRFLQGNNKNKEVQWGVHTYKKGDPILFNESPRFKPLIHNNLKGSIISIESSKDQIQFDIEIDKSINGIDVIGFDDLELLGESNNGKSIIRFSVNRLPSTDDDEESSSAVVPFQVAYAVSVHKAQGLEYNSVKVVITDELDDMVTHNIFYTSITRAREKLKIYWTPTTEDKILHHLQLKHNSKDELLLKNKFSL